MTTFSSHYTVTIGDINYGGHMGNERALLIFQDARIRMLKSLGYSEMNIGENKGIIVVNTQISYLKEIFLHDELLTNMKVALLEEKKLVLHHKIVRKRDSIPVLQGSTDCLCFDYTLHQVARFSQSFKEDIANFREEELF